ncbi:hypothetical protein GCM10018965_096280 [Nonomuraea roseola]
MLASGDEMHLGAAPVEGGAHVRADGAGAENSDLHTELRSRVDSAFGIQYGKIRVNRGEDDLRGDPHGKVQGTGPSTDSDTGCQGVRSGPIAGSRTVRGRGLFWMAGFLG